MTGLGMEGGGNSFGVGAGDGVEVIGAVGSGTEVSSWVK